MASPSHHLTVLARSLLEPLAQACLDSEFNKRQCALLATQVRALIEQLSSSPKALETLSADRDDQLGRLLSFAKNTFSFIAEFGTADARLAHFTSSASLNSEIGQFAALSSSLETLGAALDCILPSFSSSQRQDAIRADILAAKEFLSKALASTPTTDSARHSTLSSALSRVETLLSSSPSSSSARQGEASPWYIDPKKIEYLETRKYKGNLEPKEFASGQFGLVFKAKYQGMEVAVKQLKPKFSTLPNAMELFRKEADLNFRLHHNNVIHMYGGSDMLDEEEGLFPFLVLELMDYSLADAIENRTLEVHQRIPLARQLAEALEFMHSQRPRIEHRDLKPLNILLGRKNTVLKVIDFGFALEVHVSKLSKSLKTGAGKGTRPYMAPELSSGGGDYKVDTYAFGATVFEMLTLQPLYPPSFTDVQIISLVEKGGRPSLEGLDPVYSILIQTCWAQNPKERPELSRVVTYLRLDVKDKAVLFGQVTNANVLQKIEASVDFLVNQVGRQIAADAKKVLAEEEDFENYDMVAPQVPKKTPPPVITAPNPDPKVSKKIVIVGIKKSGVDPQPSSSSSSMSSKKYTCIVALGGNFFNTAELYDEATSEWTPLPNMLSKRGEYPAIGFSSNKIYVVGGYDGNNTFASAEVLDLATLTWTALPPIGTQRFNTSGVFLADGLRFLVTGGWDGYTLSSCEVFDTTSNTWTPVASLSGPRGGHCTVLYKGRPVVLGGHNGASLNTCEEYDPAANKWTFFPSFDTTRCQFGAAVVDGKVYIAGGWNWNNRLDSIEVFDGDAWSMVSTKLASPRSYCAAVCLSNKLVVLGGTQETVEVHDPATNTVSSDLVPKMKVNPKRRYLAAVSF